MEKMDSYKVYRVWTGSNHHVQYTLAYLDDKDVAQEKHDEYCKSAKITASSPPTGIEEITVYKRINL